MTETQRFFDQHPVFTLTEFRSALGAGRSDGMVRNQLSYQVKRGRLCKVGEGGVYCVVSSGNPSGFCGADRFLVASKLRSDAVIAYHSAFEFMGGANQVFTTTLYTSRRYKPALCFEGTRYQCVRRPERDDSLEDPGFVTERTSGTRVRLTSRERTVLDCLDRPGYGGGWEEVFRCVVMLPVLDLDWVLRYLRARQKPTLAAKVGCVVEAYRELLHAPDNWLEEVATLAPKGPVSLDRRPGGTFVRRWNLVVPREFLRGLAEAALHAPNFTGEFSSELLRRWEYNPVAF